MALFFKKSIFFLILLLMLGEAAFCQESSDEIRSLTGINSVNLFFFYQVGTDTNVDFGDIDAEFYRFPGGTIANFYHASGVGYGLENSRLKDQHKPMSRWIRKFGKVAANRNFIEDFIEFLNSIERCKVLYVANIIDGSSDEVIESIKLFENNGIEVIGIELGNELYWGNYLKLYDGVFDYLDRAEAFTKDIQTFYPEMRVAVVAAPFGLKYSFFDKWNMALAKETFYDAIVYHSYIPENEWESSDEDPFLAYSEFLLDILENFHWEMNESIVYLFGEEKKVWLTEWNLKTSKEFSNTMLHLLFNVTYQLLLATNDQITIASFHCLVADFDTFPLLKTEKDMSQKDSMTFIRTSSYYSFLLSAGFLKDDEYQYADHCFYNEDKVISFDFFNIRSKSNEKVVINWSANSVEPNLIFDKDFKYKLKQGLVAENLSSKPSNFEFILNLNDTGIPPHSVTVFSNSSGN